MVSSKAYVSETAGKVTKLTVHAEHSEETTQSSSNQKKADFSLAQRKVGN
jgi:hypothetical protein